MKTKTRVDLHNHTTLCNHATGTMEEYVQKAISLGIDVFGFSDHAPMKFEPEYRMTMEQRLDYENGVLYLREKYKNDIEILLGYEVDYMSNSDFIESDILNANVDYLIGSVHFLDDWGFDNPAFLKQYQNRDIDKIWEEYFYGVKQLAQTGYFDIVGHLDLMKVFKFLPKKDIKILALDSLKAIKKANMVVEINSAGFRKPIEEQYPSRDLLELAFELDIPITFGSDAHSVEQVGYKYDEVVTLAKQIGYTKCITFKNKQRKFVTF